MDMPTMTTSSKPDRQRARTRARRVHPAIEETEAEVGNEATAGSDHPTAAVSMGDDQTSDAAANPGPSGAASEALEHGIGGQIGQIASGRTGVLDEFHRRLASSAKRCYPIAAQRLRLRGEVGLHFCLTGDGREAEAALHGTTGSPILDRAARQCVLAGALPAPGIPGCYDVPIKFDESE
jgi:TonB family protein